MRALPERPTWFAVYPPSEWDDGGGLNVEPEAVCPVAAVVGFRRRRAVAIRPDGRVKRVGRGALVVCRPTWRADIDQISSADDPVVAAYFGPVVGETGAIDE